MLVKDLFKGNSDGSVTERLRMRRAASGKDVYACRMALIKSPKNADVQASLANARRLARVAQAYVKPEVTHAIR